ncbi:MAG: hypothetical protein Dasosvirus3_12 [Dasosvirus sp.]|uniref:Uncharacterized protein n=1 Tax=Dasosvirus sp. TaxID=2487764 RepID=A0A3G4ZV17_9VIRU|nr:MAG: hypothetical protein Dasosvirus3_12 [Dasosvirus sp.]
MNSTPSIVRGAGYFILHSDEICERHLFGSYTILRQECECRINQSKQTEQKEGRHAKSVSFYATDGTLLENMKLDNIDIDIDLHERMKKMLDRSVRFVATGIYIGPLMKNDTSIFVDFNIGEKKNSEHISFFNVNGQTKEQILAGIKENPFITSRFDVSGITVHNITINEERPVKFCSIL